MKLEKFPTVETERFLLRQMTHEDAPAVFEIFSEVDVTRDMGIDPFTDLHQAHELIDFMNHLYIKNRAFRWAIVKKDDHTVIGTCGFNGWETERGSRGEIAYDLGKKHWRQGYMTEIVQGVITFGFEAMELYRIEAFTNLDAMPSIRLLQKLGFHEDGILRGYSFIHGAYADQRCFSLLKNEWTHTG
jgi:[ribosomal protein S5]-alanine N-acetyltransferase